MYTTLQIWESFSIGLYTARKASWNPAGVEPVHWKPENIITGSLTSGTHRENNLIHLGVNDTKKKKDIRGWKPASKKILGWICGILSLQGVIQERVMLYRGIPVTNVTGIPECEWMKRASPSLWVSICQGFILYRVLSVSNLYPSVSVLKGECWWVSVLKGGCAEGWVCWRMSMLNSECVEWWVCWRVGVLKVECVEGWVC